MAIKIQGNVIIDDNRGIVDAGISTISGITINSGIISATSGIATFYGDGSGLTGVSGGSGAFSYCCTSNITSTNLTSHPDITGAVNNFFAGCGAGCSITSGNYNNFLGFYAGRCNTTGSSNNLIGSYAGYCNDSGSQNVFIGSNAGRFNICGSWNTIVGDGAGDSNTFGNSNNAIGYYAGHTNTTGSYNQFFGNSSGYFNTVGGCNNFFGAYTGLSTSASYKVILGTGSYDYSTYFDSPDTDKDKQFAVGINTTGTAEYWLVGNENLNIGIGTTNPQYKLDVGGDLNFTGTLYQNGVAFSGGGGAFSYCCTSNITSTNLTSHPDITSANNNFFAGCGAGCSITSGTNNIFIGCEVGRFNTTGCFNTFFGYQTGYCNTGSYNTIYGCYAGYQNTGFYNNFFGDYTGQCNQGNYNNFIGNKAGRYNTTGECNNFLGYEAGYCNTTGGYNNFFGACAGRNNTDGGYNNFFGCAAGFYNTIGGYNNFFGNQAGYCNDTGGYNNFLGNFAGYNNTTGCHNNFFGCAAGFYNTTGGSNNFLGYQAGYCNTTGSWNNFFGSYAGYCNTTGTSNIFFGTCAGYMNDTGYNNNFIGNCSGKCNTTGYDNNFLGRWAGYYSTTGSNNNFIGNYAGGYNTTGSYNNYFGHCAGGFSETGCYNNFIGNYAGIDNCGSYNVFLGNRAGATPNNSTSSNKIIIGSGTDSNNFDSPDTTKDTQLAIGIRTDSNPANYWLVGNENFNIGIGTTNPQAKLHVGGDVIISAGVDTTKYIAIKAYEDNGGTLSFEGTEGQLFSITNNLTSGSIFNVNDINANPILDANANGNLGIGTTNPQYKLDVDGDLNFSGTLYQNGVAFIGGGGGTSSQWVTSTAGIHTLSNVGIGTTNPLSKLQVQGDLIVASGTDASKHITIKSYQNNGGTLSFEGSEGQLFSISNDLTNSIFGVNDLSGNEFFTANVNSNVGIGTTTPTDKLTVQNGNIRVGVNTSNGLILTDANGVSWRLIVNTDGTLGTVAI